LLLLHSLAVAGELAQYEAQFQAAIAEEKTWNIACSAAAA
jgi:hypothetical protein